MTPSLTAVTSSFNDLRPPTQSCRGPSKESPFAFEAAYDQCPSAAEPNLHQCGDLRAHAFENIGGSSSTSLVS